jgi:hypothetical protein
MRAIPRLGPQLHRDTRHVHQDASAFAASTSVRTHTQPSTTSTLAQDSHTMGGPKDEVTIALLTDKDITTSFQVLSTSFGHDAPFVDIYFPAHDTPAGREQGSKRMQAWKDSSPSSTFLKAVINTGQGNQERIIGLAIWTHMKEAPPAELDQAEDVVEIWPDVEDREFMTQLWRDYVVPRTRTIEESQGKGVYGKCILSPFVHRMRAFCS